jgi:hypothetical protein
MGQPDRNTVARDDRVFALTRIVAACIVPFLVAAFVILYLYPDLSGERFAWKIQPNFTAFWIGTGYLGGGWFFLRVVLARRWHHVTLGFPPVCMFVIVMAVATLIHWDRFNAHHLPFQLWVVLYALTPVVVPTLWLWNRRTDPKVPQPGAILAPDAIRLAMGVVGAALLLVAVWIFVSPASAILAWAWKLTPLTARVMAGWFSLSGVGGVVLAFEPRWTAWRILLQSMMLWLALLTLGIWRAWDEFDVSRVSFAAVLAVPVSLVALALIYALQEARTGRAVRGVRTGTT